MNGTQVCGRVNPNAGARDGAPLRLAADLNNMHLIDDATGQVIYSSLGQLPAATSAEPLPGRLPRHGQRI